MSYRCLNPLISWKKSKVVKNAAVRRTRQNGKKWRLEPFWCVRGTASFQTTLERFYDLRGLRHLQPTFYASKPGGVLNLGEIRTFKVVVTDDSNVKSLAAFVPLGVTI